MAPYELNGKQFLLDFRLLRGSDEFSQGGMLDQDCGDFPQMNGLAGGSGHRIRKAGSGCGPRSRAAARPPQVRVLDASAGKRSGPFSAWTAEAHCLHFCIDGPSTWMPYC